MSFTFVEGKGKPKITVIGVGGAGRNALKSMIEADLGGVNFIIVDTNKIGMESSNVPVTIQIGEKLTGGLGTGSNPKIGKAAAEESIEALKTNIPESHMFFLAAGFGGGTGTGATPIVAQICRECSDLIIGVVSKPFSFEGRKKLQVAETGINALKDIADTIITIPNDRMRDIASKESKLVDIFKKADEVLHQSVKVIIDLISINGYVSLDFADIKSILQNAGNSIIGVGSSTGPDRANEAVEQAISHPLFENVQLSGAQKALVNISSNHNITFEETTLVSDRIKDAIGENAEIIWGQTFDESFNEMIQVTVIVTGI